jgi:hypothetical protein
MTHFRASWIVILGLFCVSTALAADGPAAQDEVVPPQLLKALAELESRYAIVSGSGQFKKRVYYEADNTRSTSSGNFEIARKRGMSKNIVSNIKIVDRKGKESRRGEIATFFNLDSRYALRRPIEGGQYQVLWHELIVPRLAFPPLGGDIGYCDQCPYSLQAFKLSALIRHENYVFIRQQPVDLDGKSMLKLEFGPSKALWESVNAAMRMRYALFTCIVVVSPKEGWAVQRFTSFNHRLTDGRLQYVLVGNVEYRGSDKGTPVPSRYTLKHYETKNEGEKIRLENGGEITGYLRQEETWQFDKIRFEPEPDSAFALKAFGLPEINKPK